MVNVQYPSQPGGWAKPGIGATPSVSSGMAGPRIGSAVLTVWLQTEGLVPSKST